MTILILSWRDPKHPLSGGAEQSVWEHAKGWRDAGYKITWFSSRFAGSKQKEVLDGIEIVRGGCQYGGVQIAAFFYYFKNKKNIDLVVDQFHGFPFFTPLYIAKPRLAIIQEVAEKVWFLNPLPRPFNWLVGLIGYLSEPLVFKLYKNTPFMTGSDSAKKDVAGFGINLDNVTVVPHGVTLPGSNIKHQISNIPTITFLGVLSRDKGIEEAIKCFGILKTRGNFRFWVIGKPESEKYFNRLKRLVKSLELGGKVKFWGFVDQKKKFELLARSHVLINPSVHEGWGLVNIEANAVGTPVVAYNSAGLIDSVKDGISGEVVRKNSPEELARAAGGILENRIRYKKLQKGARSWSRNFSWEKSNKLSLILIERLVNSPRKRYYYIK